MRFLSDENIPVRISAAFRELGEPLFASERMPGLGKGAQDEQILPFCAENNYILVTLDRKMRTASPHTRRLLRELRVGVFFLYSGRKASPDPWEIFTMLVKHWSEMTRLARRTRQPFSKMLRPRGAIVDYRTLKP